MGGRSMVPPERRLPRLLELYPRRRPDERRPDVEGKAFYSSIAGLRTTDLIQRLMVKLAIMPRPWHWRARHLPVLLGLESIWNRMDVFDEREDSFSPLSSKK